MDQRVNRIPFIITGIVLAFATGVLFTWPYFRAPLAEMFPTWTPGNLSTVFSLHNALVCVSMFLTGIIAKRVPRRALFAVSAALIAIGLGMYSLLPADDPGTAYRMAFVGFAVIAAAGAGISATCWMGTFVLWVPDHVGLMAGGMLFMYGSCPLVYGAISSVMIPVIGIGSTIAALGGTSAALILLVLPWARLPRPGEILPPAPHWKENKSDASYTPRQMLKTPSFWALFLFSLSIRSAGLIFVDHSADIAMSVGATAMFGMLYAPANGSSSFLAGMVVDKLGSYKTMRIVGAMLFMSSVVLYLGSKSGIMAIALVGLISAGFAFGGSAAVTSSSIRILFGSKHYTQNFSTSTVSILIASLFSFIGGMLVDAMEGSFNGVYIMTTILAVVAIICTVTLSAYIRKIEASEQRCVSDM